MNDDAPLERPGRRRAGQAAAHWQRLMRLSLRDLLATAGPVLALTLALLVLAYLLLDPAPPRRMVLATGPERSAYAEFGQRYAAALARQGIRVELRATDGAAQNLALLQQPGSGVDVGFVLGGTTLADTPPAGGAAAARGTPGSDHATPAEAAPVALGSLFLEPVWLFYRRDAAQRLLHSEQLSRLAQLSGWRVSVGAPGSGVPALMARLVEANGLAADALQMLPRADTPAVVDLLEGRLDAVVLATAPESLMVQMLLRTPGIALLDFAQAEAYARRLPFLSPVRLPRGIVDLAADQPPDEVRLVAPTATLLARADTHPALLQLLVQAAHGIHGGAGWFQRAGDFPNSGATGFALSAEAARWYRNGAPWLQRWLPFWLANVIDRMWVVLLSIVAVLIPLSRVVPPLYDFRVRSRVFRWYGQLRAVEAGFGQRPRAALLAELDDIDRHVGAIRLPLSYADALYALRGHIALVRQRVGDPPGADALAPPPGRG